MVAFALGGAVKSPPDSSSLYISKLCGLYQILAICIIFEICELGS